MSMLDHSCKHFLSDLASKAPVPGGGGAAALTAATGVALADMVGNLTAGKKKYTAVEPEIQQLLARGEKLLAELEALVDRDAEVFEPLARAYRLPKATPEQENLKNDAIEKCAKVACSVPLEIMRKSCEGIEIQRRMGVIGTELAVSDVGCGAALLKAALVAGSLNVQINLNLIKDRPFVETTRKEMAGLLEVGSEMADATLALVTERLTQA